MVQGIYVPIIVLVILIVIAVGVALLKGVEFLKGMLEWFITAIISYMAILLIMNIGFPEVWVSVSEQYRIYVMGLFNVGMTLPATFLLKLLLKPVFKALRWTKVIGR